MCLHKSFWRGTKFSQILGLAQKFGPAQNILGPVKGQGINLQICFEEQIFLILYIVIRQQNFCSNRKMCPSLKRAWIFLRKVHESLAKKKSPKIVSLVKEKLVVVIDRVRYLPLCPEPKGQFTPIIFFLTNPGTPREKKGQKLLLKF